MVDVAWKGPLAKVVDSVGGIRRWWRARLVQRMVRLSHLFLHSSASHRTWVCRHFRPNERQVENIFGSIVGLMLGCSDPRHVDLHLPKRPSVLDDHGRVDPSP